MLMRNSGLVWGMGINDCETTMLGDERCPFYMTWKSMLQRAYSEAWKIKQPTYNGVTVCKEWLKFSNFKAWMQAQDWEGKELDKDLLVQGNKVYSPETCTFVDSIVNKFLTKRQNHRGEWPIGVYYKKDRKKFVAQCSDPTANCGKSHLGYFDTPEEAHNAWLQRKLELANTLANMQKDSRIAKALLEANYHEWE